MREYLIEQEIDEHARDGHVHPERPGPARNPPVLIKPFAQPAHQRDQNHRDDHDSQKSVCQQNEQVDRPKPCRLKEARRATVQDIGEIPADCASATKSGLTIPVPVPRMPVAIISNSTKASELLLKTIIFTGNLCWRRRQAQRTMLMANYSVEGCRRQEDHLTPLEWEGFPSS